MQGEFRTSGKIQQLHVKSQTNRVEISLLTHYIRRRADLHAPVVSDRPGSGGRVAVGPVAPIVVTVLEMTLG